MLHPGHIAQAVKLRCAVHARYARLNVPNRGAASRERQTVWSARNAPRTSRTSPMLKTLLAGKDAGTQKTSPRKPIRASSIAVELANAAEVGSRRAAASASGSAGMTPPLTAIAVRFNAPPEEMTHM